MAATLAGVVRPPDFPSPFPPCSAFSLIAFPLSWCVTSSLSLIEDFEKVAIGGVEQSEQKKFGDGAWKRCPDCGFRRWLWTAAH